MFKVPMMVRPIHYMEDRVMSGFINQYFYLMYRYNNYGKEMFRHKKSVNHLSNDQETYAGIPAAINILSHCLINPLAH
jgi:hypothetical protein